MMTEIGAQHKYHYRGDNQAYDFTVSNFTTDGDPHELDLSSIIPAGAIAAHIFLAIRDGAAESYILFLKKGTAYTRNRLFIQTQVANLEIEIEGIVALGADRKVKYISSNLAFDTINFEVKGWFT